MSLPTLIELAESGAHYGHHKSITFPKAKKNVFMVKNEISLINLENTLSAINSARTMYKEAKNRGANILLIGTKNNCREVVKEIALRENLSYVTERWFGGTLTNFNTVFATLKKMSELTSYLADTASSKLSKKERLVLSNKLARSERFLGGMVNLTGLPELIIVASASQDKIAVAEAAQVGVPVIAITDTDFNPELVDIAVPANDDAPKAVELVLSAILSGEKSAPVAVTEEVKVEKEAKVAVKKAAVKDKKEPKATAKKAVKKAVKKTAKK